MCQYKDVKNIKDHNEIIQLSTRKFTGEASAEEAERLEKLISENEENHLLYKELVGVWDGTDKAKGITQKDVSEEWLRLRREIRNADKKSFSFLKIAASVALIATVGIAFFLFQNDKTTYLIAEQVQAQTLQDGSIVTLNAESELSYPAEFLDKGTREVNLKGEAFFEVERNPEKPFIIHTPSVQIEVLGTSFSVRSRNEEKTTTVIVASGSVKVSGNSNALVLKVNEKAIFDKESGKLFKVVNDDPNYLSWKTKQFTFDDRPLHEVAKSLSTAYQTSIRLMAESINDCPVTVSFDGQSLDAILEILSTTLDLTVEKTSEGFEISGKGC